MKIPTTILALALLFAGVARAETLSPEAAAERAAAGELVLIDVRLASEWAATGLPEGALPIALQDPRTLAVRPGFVDDVLDSLNGDRTREIALICATGVRSAFAARLLESHGFSAVHDVGEGMAGSGQGQGWLARALPTEPCTVC
jgi:rhodanese-related sulfurtransferase